MRPIHFSLLTATALTAAAEPRPMAAPDIFALPILSKGHLSPDGDTLLFQKSTIDWDANRWEGQLWRKTLSTGELRQLTYRSASSYSPLPSPDGSKFIFLSERDDDDFAQIYLMPSDGGEARRIAELPTAPKGITWSPDSKSLYYTAPKPLSKERRNDIRKKTVIPRFEDPAKGYQLFRLEIENGKATRIGPKDGSIFGYTLSRDGQELIFRKSPGPLIDDAHRAELWTADADGKNAQQITDNAIAEYSASLSPDRKAISYLATVNDANEGYYQSNLFLLDRATNKRTLLLPNWNAEVADYAWDQEGTGLYLLGNIGVSHHLFHHELGSGEVEQLTSGDWTIKEWHYDPIQDRHLIKKMSATEPGDYWTLGGQETTLTRSIDIFSKISKQYQLPKQERIQWKSDDSTHIEGLLTYPVNHVPGENFPLVIDVHGGPQKSSQFGMWHSGRFLPALAAQGYGILLPNHRGSTGYGDDFMRDMVGNYFRNSHLDVLAGADHLIAQGLADPDRLIIKGWSAGGHMTNKLITYTDRFRAASSGAGAVEWMSQYGETDTSARRTYWFGGKPWEQDAPIANYLKTSVLDDLWKVKTPTLIFVGQNDVRVPASQSKILFRGLRDLGVETELYVAPGEPHGYRRPSHRLFRINKELEWFARHVLDEDYEYQLPPE